MKVGSTKLIMATALLALAFIVDSSAALAQNCPTAPNYSPDFTSNQGCLTLNNNGTVQGYPGFYPAVPPPPSGVTTVLRLTPNASFTAGSAWFNTTQPVSSAFSTNFTFQLSGGNTQQSPADGIAFVIQNSASSALGPEGCGIGFGDDTLINCAPPTGGITNSVAVEFNTFLNGGIDPSNSDVTIQNCQGTGANSVDPACTVAVLDLTQLQSPISLADGKVHSATINYSGPSTKLLDVIVDGVDLFPGGIVFDMTTIGLNNGNAWVGFTAATGGGDDNQDILSWTFVPQSQTAVITTTSPTTLTFPNAAGTNVYDYNAQLTVPYATPVLTVQPILMTSAACNALVQKNFWPARCFVYQNAENSGMDAAVMFAVTCPTSPGGTCGTVAQQNFFATLGTDFEFSYSDNPLLVYPGILGLLNPFPGFLKGAGNDPLNPCTPPTSGPLFQSNQIASFSVAGDPGGKTKGSSSGTGSCWVATYDTPGEIWPAVTITSPKGTTYTKGQVVTAAYACNNPITSKPVNSPTGPYLTAASCTQSSGTQAACAQTSSGLSCSGTVDTSSKGLHVFSAIGIDSGGNQNINAVIYNVK